MGSHDEAAPRLFRYDEVRALLPHLRRVTDDASRDVEALMDEPGRFDPHRAEIVVHAWVDFIHALGARVNGLWLVDFDTGSGFYCWKHLEPDVLSYRSYEEGYSERVRIQ